MRTPSLRLSHVALLSAALVAVSAGPVFAESACKGLEQAICEGKGDCTWVNGYTRKDGKQISGHCKAIGKRSDSSAAKPEKQVSKATE